jgi:hypothetical protein
LSLGKLLENIANLEKIERHGAIACPKS